MIQVRSILILTSIKAITQSPIMRLLHHFSPFSTTIIITFHNFATFIGELVIIYFELILQWFFVYRKIFNIVWCPFNQMGINLGESLTHLFQFQSRHTDIRQRFLQRKKLPLWDSRLIHLRWSELGKSMTRCPITPPLPLPPSLPPCILIIPILFPLHQELWCQGEGDVSC